MKNLALRAYRTLVRIRIRRQEALDQTRIEAQQELLRLADAVDEKLQELDDANERVANQIRLIDDLVQSGRQFQIADYLAQQDYQTSLEGIARACVGAHEQAVAQVDAQQVVLEDARKAANANIERRQRLEEHIRKILLDIDVRQMDSDDEEAEEAVVMRKLMKKTAAKADAAGEHA